MHLPNGRIDAAKRRFSQEGLALFLAIAMLFAAPALNTSLGATPAIVDATKFGAVADYEQIECATTAAGRVTRLIKGRKKAFQPSDVGKCLIIQSARAWTEYSPEPTPFNARISAVDAEGVATAADLDGGERGSMVESELTSAELFTDNTDAIALAIDAQVKAKSGYVLLPTGVVGLCPMASKTWAANPVLDNITQARAVFVMQDGASLRGGGRDATQLKVAYFGEFELYGLQRKRRFRFSPLLFLFQPLENQVSHIELASFSVELPFSPVVMSGYTLATDTWNTCPPRHAIQATLRDIGVIDRNRNGRLFDSSFGGIYDSANRVVAESVYRFEQCDFETGGGSSIKNQNGLGPADSGGKQIHLKNVIYRGGGNIATRHYLDCAKLLREGNHAYIEVAAAGFSWQDFNAHSDQSEGPYQPWCRLRKAYCGAIGSVRPLPDGSVELTLEAPAGSPVSQAACPTLINFGLGDKQIFLADAATLTAGSRTAIVRWAWALSAEEMARLTGAPIRIYHEENLVHTVRDALTPRRIRIDPQSVDGLTLLGQDQLDITVNAPDKVPGAFGHTFYVGRNVSIYADGLKIYGCAKRSFRVSSGGSSARQGAHEFIAYEALPACGMAAFCNGQTVFQPLEEFEGLLKLRRSKASSVYAVTLDMDDRSTFVSQGGVVEGSRVRNSTLFGHVGQGHSVVEDSRVAINLCRLDREGNRENIGIFDDGTAVVTLRNCQGSVELQNGAITSENGQLSIRFGGDSVQYERWKGAIKGDLTTASVTMSCDNLNEAQRRDLYERLRLPPPNAKAK